MNIIFRSGHPAQIHNFRNARAELIKDGHNVYWLTTPKDIATNLLDIYGIPYEVLYKPKPNIFSIAWAFIRNVIWEVRFMRKHKIDLVVSRICPFTTVAAKLCGVKHIVTDDTEHAAGRRTLFSNRVDTVLMPSCFSFQLRKDELRYPGNIELFYLHPKRFTPKPVWDLLGIEPNTRFAIVRFVKWDAWHDTQLVGGFTLDQKRTLIRRLQAHMRVFISSESELPADLEPDRIHIPIEQMHHVQAAAALFVGESATMASESVCLGTPAIYIDQVGRGYTDEEAREGLLWMFRPVANRSSMIIKENDKENSEENIKENKLTKNDESESKPKMNNPQSLDNDSQLTHPYSAQEQALGQTNDSSIVANALPDYSTKNDIFDIQEKNTKNGCAAESTKNIGGKVEPWWISGGVEECIDKAEEIASAGFDREAYAKRYAAWFATKIDCTAFLTWFIENYPASVFNTRHADASFWGRFK